MSERIYLLPKQGTWYKANLHCHSTVSDGALTPAEIKKMYKEQGYHIVAFTDHIKYVPHPELNDDGFIALAGLEAEMNEIRFGEERIRTRMYHINLYDTNPQEIPELKAKYCVADYWNHDVAYVNSYIKKMSELGFIACYNHPYWSMHNSEEYIPIEGLFAMEIYNHGCELCGAYGYTPQAYDEMLRAGKNLWCVFADDNHNEYPKEHVWSDSFGGYVMICMQEFTYENVIQSLKEGCFYSSMGPEIKAMYIENRELVVETAPIEKIYINTQIGIAYKKVAQKDEKITEARFFLTGNEGYIRVTLKDGKGRFANSNAYFVDRFYESELAKTVKHR